MRFADFPFLRYLPFLIAGVLCSQFKWSVVSGFPLLTLLVFWLGYLVILVRKRSSTQVILPFLGYLMVMIVGFSLSKIQEKRALVTLDTKLESAKSYLGQVEKYDLEKPNSFENLIQVIAQLDSSGWQKSSGKVLIYHRGGSPLIPGQVVLVEGSPDPIPSAVFPNEFDYQGFLGRKDIHFRQFVGDKISVFDSSQCDGPKYWLASFRKNLTEIIESKIHDPASQQIASALLLGQKDNLDKDIKNAYAETGTMHILAVSGLHVGIIYAILLFPLKGIKLKPKHRKIYLSSVILLIWIYALLTGFSPSVIRAATMFSLFTAGQMRNRKPSSFNILAFSAMVMIALDPGVIYEVGFQLSYVAVAGILLIQPLIARFWIPPNMVLEYFWQLTAVSLAAQLVTFPLSVYYFHIFPSYFLIANLVIIPLSFLVMTTGILFLATSWVPFLGDELGGMVNGLIWVQNWLTRTIQLFPGGNLDRLTITCTGMLLVWGILIIWANWELGDRKKLVFVLIYLFLIWSGDRLLREVNRPAEELLIFSEGKGLLLDFTIGANHYSWNSNFPTDQISFSVDPNRIAHHRPILPESAVSSQIDSLTYFPIWDFTVDWKNNTFFWQSNKPKLIEELSNSTSLDLNLSDTLQAKKGAFRVIF